MTEGANIGALTTQIVLDASELEKGATLAARALDKLVKGSGILKDLNFQLTNFANVARGMERAASALAGVGKTLQEIGKGAKSLKSLGEIGPDLAKGGAAISAFTTHLIALGAARPAITGIKQDLREMSAAAQALTRQPSPRTVSPSRFELPRGSGIPLGPVPMDPRALRGQAIDLERTISLRAKLLRIQGQTVSALTLEMQVAVMSASRQGASLERLAALQRVYQERILQAATSQEAMVQSSHRMSDAMNNTSQAISRVVGMVQRMVAAYLIFKTGQFFTDAIRNAESLESMGAAFEAIRGTPQGAAREIQFLRDESDRLGIKLLTTADSWKKFLAATQGAGFGLEQSRSSFIGVAEAAVAMRLNNEEVAGTFRNLGQMASKGVVQMEELRDLSEHLPGAFALFAAGMGKTTMELQKLVKATEKGGVMPVNIIKFAEKLQEKFGPGLDKALSGATASFGRLSNAWLEFKVAMAEGGLFEKVVQGVQGLTRTLKDPGTLSAISGFGRLIADSATIAWQALSAFPRGVIDFLRELRGDAEKTSLTLLALRPPAFTPWQEFFISIAKVGYNTVQVFEFMGRSIGTILATIGKVIVVDFLGNAAKALWDFSGIVSNALQFNWGGVRESAQNFLGNLKAFYFDAGESSKAMTQAIAQSWEEMLKKMELRSAKAIFEGPFRSGITISKRSPEESRAFPGFMFTTPPPLAAPGVDEKAAHAAQMSLERTLDLRQELLRLQKKGIEALEVEKEHDLAAAMRRKALPMEISAINALHAERIRLFKEEAQMEAGGLRAAIADPFPEIYSQERSLRKILAERAGDQQGIVNVLDEELGLLREQSTILAGDPGSLEKRLGVETQINELLGKRGDLQEKIRDLLTGKEIQGPPIAPFLEMEEARRATLLDQARWQFGRGQIGRQDLLGQLAGAQGRAEEEWRASPTDENLRKILALNQEQADLTIDIWFEAQAAIADNWMQVVEGAENMGEALLGVFKDIGRNISRILIQDVSQGIVNALKKSVSGTGGKGMASAIGDMFKGGNLAGILQAAGSGLSKVWGAIKGTVFGGGGPLQGPEIPGAPLPGGQQGPSIPGAPIPTSTAGLGQVGGGIAAIGNFAGQMIGGKAGGALSGAATGAMIGSMIMPGLGTAIGAVVGGAAGLFGAGKDKKKDPIRAAIKQWVEQEWRPAWREMEAMGFGRGIFESVVSSTGIKALGWGKGIPQEALRQMKASVESLKDILSTALSDGFKASTAARGFEIFLRDIRRGIADFVTQGLIEAALKSKALTKLFAPLFEEIPKQMAELLRGGTFNPQAFQGRIMALWKGIQPALSSLEPFFAELFGAAKDFSKIGRPQGSLFGSIPSQFLTQPAAEMSGGHRAPLGFETISDRFTQASPVGQVIPGGAVAPGRAGKISVPVTIYATVNSPMDAQKMGREAADEIERELRRIG